MSMARALVVLWRRAVEIARLAIGVPNYEAYLAHMRERHPAARVMSYVEFFNERQASRYRNDRHRCC
jgi:uncharacterized short protein YbdD (DUF466 family)